MQSYFWKQAEKLSAMTIKTFFSSIVKKQQAKLRLNGWCAQCLIATVSYPCTPHLSTLSQTDLHRTCTPHLSTLSQTDLHRTCKVVAGRANHTSNRWLLEINGSTRDSCFFIVIIIATEHLQGNSLKYTILKNTTTASATTTTATTSSCAFYRKMVGISAQCTCLSICRAYGSFLLVKSTTELAFKVEWIFSTIFGCWWLFWPVLLSSW